MPTVQDPSEPFLPTRSSLLFRLKQWNDGPSWREFVDRYSRTILSFGLKRGLTRTESEDVVQETLMAVAKQMPDFQYNRTTGTFKGWLFTITRRAIGKQLDKRTSRQVKTIDPASGEFESTVALEELPDPSADFARQWDEEWRRNIIAMAMDRLRSRVKPKQFQMFDLFVTQNLPMSQVVRILNVNRAQVYMAKLRITPMLRDEILALEKELQ